MSIKRTNSKPLPNILVIIKKGKVTYGQQIRANHGEKPRFKKTSAEDICQLINSRINRPRYSNAFAFFAVVSFLTLLDPEYAALKMTAFSFLFLCMIFSYRIESNARNTRLMFRLERDHAESFQKLRKALRELSNSDRIWFNPREEANFDWKRQAGANLLIMRLPTVLEAETPPFIKVEKPEFCFTWKSTRKLVAFPDGFYLFDNNRYFFLGYEIEAIDVEAVKCVEDEKYVPRDALQIDTTWRYVRKDGGPDNRFKNNAPLPIMEYARLELTFFSGFSLVFFVSHVVRARKFANVLGEYIALLGES